MWKTELAFFFQDFSLRLLKTAVRAFSSNVSAGKQVSEGVCLLPAGYPVGGKCI
ncbi:MULTISPECIES: hypothetical protein [unclassified Methanosarcina]|uniref:hypothetical protein n=1 Tax=unclassified Methanosarcina TaxID=2644672 RepID=UPI0025E8D381|nr:MULTISPECIES: hypothetical protein [unclassified Methanosarcina]